MTDELDAKDPDDDAEYGVDFHDQIVAEALRRTSYAQDVVLFYPRDTGFYYVVTTAGKTGVNYPTELPVEDGETFSDGSAILVCRHPSDASVPTISSATWIVPDGITESSVRNDGLRAFITLSGGTDGEDYDVTVRVTPSFGNPLDKTITVRVRSQ